MFNNANNTYNLWNRPANQTGGVASTFSSIGTTPLQSTGTFGTFGTNTLQNQATTTQSGFGSTQGSLFNPVTNQGGTSFLGLGGSTAPLGQTTQTPLLGQTGIFNTTSQTAPTPFATGLGQTTTSAFGTSVTPTFGTTGTTSSIFGTTGTSITGQEVAKPENTGDNCILTNVTHGKPAFCQEEFRLAFYMSNAGKLPETLHQTQFGSTPTQTNTMFGSGMNTTTGLSLFGTNTATTTGNTGVFGAQSSLFGTGQQTTGTSLFGTTQPIASTNTGVFGTNSSFNNNQSSILNPNTTSSQLTFGSTQPTSFGATSTGTGLLGFGSTATNTGGGLFGTSTTGTTGIGSSNIFGSTTTGTTPTFGAQQNTLGTGSNLFGATQPSTGGLFGNTGTAVTTGGLSFGTSGSSTGGGLFATGTTGTGIGSTNLFGGSTNTSATPTFGSQTPNTGAGTVLFGTSQPNTGGIFGNTATANAAGVPGFGTTAINTGGGLFGTSSTGTTGIGSSNLFGSTTTGTTSTFGAQQNTLGTGSNLFSTTQQSTGGLFGNTSATTAAATSGNVFGTNGHNSGGGLFGTNTTGSTGVGTSNLFGGTTATSTSPTFGTQSNTFGTGSNLFGTNQSLTGGLFGTPTLGSGSSTLLGGNLFGSTVSGSQSLFGSQPGTTANSGITGQMGNAPSLFVGRMGSAGTQGNNVANANFILNWDFNTPSPGLKSFWSNMAKLPPEAQDLLNRINSQIHPQNQTNTVNAQATTHASSIPNGAPSDRFGLRQALRNMGVYIPNYSYTRKTSMEKTRFEPVVHQSAAQELEAGLAKNYTGHIKKPQKQQQHAYHEDAFLPLHNGNLRQKGNYCSLTTQQQGQLDVLNGQRKNIYDGAHESSVMSGRITSLNTCASTELFPDQNVVERPKLLGYNDILAQRDARPSKVTNEDSVSLDPLYKRHESINISDDANTNDDLLQTEDHEGPDFYANKTVTHADAATIPILTKKGYSTRPTWESIKQMDSKQLSNVMDFQIIKEGFGDILWPGYTDLRGLNIDEIVDISHRKITLYAKSRVIHEVGKGLNKTAIVTLYNCFPPQVCSDSSISSQVAQLDKLKQHTVSMGCKFISANFKTGHWMFEVPYFIKDVDSRDASSSFGYVNS